MSEAAHDTRAEFWRPQVQGPAGGSVRPLHMSACEECGTEFVVGARFCHVCGTDREISAAATGGGWGEMFDFVRLRESLGLTTLSLVAMIAGLMCLVAAIATGFVFSATTVLDWQAVQIWRIEWLLAAVAMFVAGILLKKSS